MELPLLLLLLLLSLSPATLARRALLNQPHFDYDEPLSILDRYELGLDSLPPSANTLVFISDANASNESISSSESCAAPYGFLPCAGSVLGNLFLLLVYGYLLFVAAKLMFEGSELLLTQLDAGIIGGLLLPILGALPDSLLILVSGLGGTKAEAQEQVLVGIGLLAGSVVMLLTALWGGCLLLGRCDLEPVGDELTAVDKQLTRPLDLMRTGVENDGLTKLAARIMVLSIIPYIVAQLPSIFNFSTNGNIPVLVSCLLSLGGLFAYCLYQVFSPWIQERRIEIARKRFLMASAIHQLVRKHQESLIDDEGNFNEEFAEKLFSIIDVDKNHVLVKREIEFMLRTTLSQDNVDETMVEQFMKEYDVDQDEKITLDEFKDGTKKWCKQLKLHREKSIRFRMNQMEKGWRKLLAYAEDHDEHDEEETLPSPSHIIRKAIVLLIVGTVVAAVFAEPLVDSVNDFSAASHIPSFFISFVLLPLASSSSEAMSSIFFSARKKKKNMSLTYSQIYGAITMNNTMGLGIFFAMVYFRQLAWDFSSEVLVVCLVTLVMGLLASFRRVFPTWMAGIAFLLYPVSLGLVAILDYVAGWK